MAECVPRGRGSAGAFIVTRVLPRVMAGDHPSGGEGEAWTRVPQDLLDLLNLAARL